MRPLRLDYQRSHASSRAAGMALLAAAVALSFMLYTGYSDLSAEAELAADKLARLEKLSGRKPATRATGAADLSAQEMKRAGEVLERLALPWDTLFKAVESSAGEHVALLSIQPDEKRGSVSIGGEARNVDAMLEYVRRLQQSGTLRNVHLVNHQVEVQDAQMPVRFLVVATWLDK
jgi:Tfp pilus assembly protein PilN